MDGEGQQGNNTLEYFPEKNIVVNTVLVAPTTVVSTETEAEETAPLSGLNVQLKKVQDDTCMVVDEGERWTLFQTQFRTKGRTCKLMIDGGRCANGISKAMLGHWGCPQGVFQNQSMFSG